MPALRSSTQTREGARLGSGRGLGSSLPPETHQAEGGEWDFWRTQPCLPRFPTSRPGRVCPGL